MIDQVSVGLSGIDIDKFDYLLRSHPNQKLSRAGLIKELIRAEFDRQTKSK